MKFEIFATSLVLALGLGLLLAPPVFAGGAEPVNPGTYMGDFNGDGRTDVLVSNSMTRQLYAYVTAAGIPAAANVDEAESASLTTLPEGASVQGVGDFNGDGRADILVQSGLNLAVLVSDAAVQAGNPVALDATKTGFIGAPDANWSVAGVGDANNDGLADVYLLNTGSADAGAGLGLVYVYITSLEEEGSIGKPKGSSSLSGAPIQLPVDWELRAVADMDGDGLSDFIGMAASNVGFSTLYTFISAAGGITVNGAASGTPAGVPDGYGCCAAGLTSDAATSSSFASIDEVGAESGLVYVFVTDATGVAVDAGASTNSVTVPDGWELQGLADFNNDGIVDTVAAETATGNMIVYLNSGPGTVSDVPFLTSLPTDWEVANFTGMSAN